MKLAFGTRRLRRPIAERPRRTAGALAVIFRRRIACDVLREWVAHCVSSARAIRRHSRCLDLVLVAFALFRGAARALPSLRLPRLLGASLAAGCALGGGIRTRKARSTACLLLELLILPWGARSALDGTRMGRKVPQRAVVTRGLARCRLEFPCRACRTGGSVVLRGKVPCGTRIALELVVCRVGESTRGTR